jgi:glycosyltransferase involved in cell wall biosynthesis
MVVTIICDVLGEPNNGTTVATLNLINYLKSQGHTVYVVCGDKDKQDQENYFILPQLSLGPIANKIIEHNGVTLSDIDKVTLTKAISLADVVHIQIPLFVGQTAAKIAYEMHKPLTASFHCQAENVTAHFFAENIKFANDMTYLIFYDKVYRYCDCVHYPTEFIRNVFENTTHKTNAFVISNGVNAIYINKHIAHENKKFTIISTGRYSTEKAQQLLIKAVGRSKYRDSIKIILAGEGPHKQKYERLAKRMHVETELNFYSREDLITALNMADLYVHTAFIEIEAIACIEAICCGLVPVINNAKRSATRFFALDENNLFKENTISELTKKIEFWYENPALKAEYVKKYKPMAKSFGQEECMRRMEQMLETAIEMHRE